MSKHEAQGHRLRAAIERSGIPRATLATQAGISVPYIARMLAGDRSGADHIAKMAELLGVHERWLRFGDDDVRPAWAVDATMLKELRDVTYTAQRTQPTKTEAILQVLRDLLAEQRLIRRAVERMAGPPGDDPLPVARTRFRVPPRPARASS